MSERVDPNAVSAARASYDRCCRSTEFFPAFYRNFLRACPEAEPLFAHTDFTRQHRLLRHALGLLLAFPTQAAGEPNLLARVAARHSRADLNIAPALYQPFVDALMTTVKEYDPQLTPDAAIAWRAALAPGVAYMQARY